MPWLFVGGTGSWGITLGREWDEDSARWRYDSRTYRARGGPDGDGVYQVGQEVLDYAQEHGCPGFVRFFADDDRPAVVAPDDSGTFMPEDLRAGVGSGTSLRVIDGGVPDDAAPTKPEQAEHKCAWCPREFPSPGARDRHVEFEHTRKHEIERERATAQAVREAEEKAARERLAAADEKIPPWEREAADPSG